MRHSYVLSAALILASLVCRPVRAWWDTQIMALKEVPKVAEIEAEDAAPADGADIVGDKPPVGPEAGGGKAVILKPGVGSLSWRIRLTPSVYKLFAIARVAQADPAKNGSPEWPISARMKVSGPNGTKLTR